MLKVFLVEDEFVVREGIKKKIDWEGHGYEFCGEATDGEVAFPMIQKTKPDIVITDIKMPFMDGLTLSKLIKKELPNTEIIILTGYEKFEYAKEAIKIGVAQYLSKPINSEELLKEVDAIAVKINEKKLEREAKEKYKEEMEENLLKDRNMLFRYLVSGNKSMPELLEMADRLSVDLSAIWYNVVLFEIKEINHSNSEYSDSKVHATEQLKVIEGEHRVLAFDINLEGKAYVIKGDSEEHLKEIQKEFLEKVQTTLSKYENIVYFGGKGTPVNRISELKVSFDNASRAFAYRHFMSSNRIVGSESAYADMQIAKEDFNITNVDVKQIDRNKIKEFLKIGTKEETVWFVDGFFRGLSKGAMESNIFRQYITMDCYFAVVDFVESIQASKEEIEPLDINSDVLKNYENAKSYIVRVIEQAIELREKAASNKYGDVVNEVTKYIEENYADDELSLNVVAAHVNFSPNHLSMVFSQQTGQTFIKYLTDYRINKAKELLKCSGKKSSVIAQEVGYKDPHYFSYVFRKTQGMTPTQYREGNSTEGEE